MIRIVGTDREFAELEPEWRRLETEAGSFFFSGFDYVHTAWTSFKRPSDRLLVLVSRRGNDAEWIAPFFVARKTRWGIPCREIRFIAEWEGDRPGILTKVPPEEAWRGIVDFLVNEVGGWDALTLAEQPAAPVEGRRRWVAGHPSCRWEETPDGTGYHISLRGTYDAYFDGIRSKVKANLRNRTKRLYSRSPDVSVECVEDPGRMPESLSRFVALEQSGWKKEAGLGVAKDERHRRFYERLLVLLAGKGNAGMYFLKAGGEDVSTAMIFRHRGILIERHIAYSPAYSEYTPGVILRCMMLQGLFGGKYEEFDMLGMREDESGPRHKTDWATGRRETVRIEGYRTRSRLLPWILARDAKRLLKRDGKD
ncbi:MAG: GNAT family N-acetyltransferase [Deltaproteobacteria bacterium]|nr:GNAT family N-acetyltransferase [Deltaproteobacteria bacterium]